MTDSPSERWAARVALAMTVTGFPADVIDRMGMPIGSMYTVSVYLSITGVLMAVGLTLKGVRSPLDCRTKSVTMCAIFVGLVMLATMAIDLWVFQQRLVGVTHSVPVQR